MSGRQTCLLWIFCWPVLLPALALVLLVSCSLYSIESSKRLWLDSFGK